MMYPILEKTIQALLSEGNVSDQRKSLLKPLIEFVQEKVNAKQELNINFICTHNSRRSHLSQAWAQVAAAYFGVKDVFCYSGGTEATSLFPKVAETLASQGFNVIKLSSETNPVYAIKFDPIAPPIIGFSKKYDHSFNPVSDYVAVMTCAQAESECPFIPGAEKRFPLTYEDPKTFDNSPRQTEVYAERSLQIAAEMLYIFSQIKA